MLQEEQKKKKKFNVQAIVKTRSVQSLGKNKDNHIEVNCLYTRKNSQAGYIKLAYCNTKNIADIFTKAVSGEI